MNFFTPSLLDEVRKADLTFESGTYEYRSDALYFDSQKSKLCPHCSPEAVSPEASGRQRKRFHRHGWYPRKLFTYGNGKTVTEIVWNLRWLCVICGHTQSITPPGILRRRHACSLVIFLVLWIYLNSPYGVERCDFRELGAAAERKRVFRSLRDARATALETHQSIREAMLEKIKPETWERLTLSGLSPPPPLSKCQNPQTHQVWETLSLLMRGAVLSVTPLNILLARAHERSLKCGRPFLTSIQGP